MVSCAKRSTVVVLHDTHDKTEMSIWWLRFYQELTMRCMTRIDLKPTHDRASPTMAAPRRGAPGRYAASPFIV
jgi:hypothetical protein